LQHWADEGLEVVTVPQISVGELAEELKNDARLRIVDVRRGGEFASAHVPGARNIPLNELEQQAPSLRGERLAVICAGGYRSSAATSLLQRAGVEALLNVTGGTSAWVAAGLPTVTR
jgi:rhodanese-related sulfurtransferase